MEVMLLGRMWGVCGKAVSQITMRSSFSGSSESGAISSPEKSWIGERVAGVSSEVAASWLARMLSMRLMSVLMLSLRKGVVPARGFFCWGCITLTLVLMISC